MQPQLRLFTSVAFQQEPDCHGDADWGSCQTLAAEVWYLALPGEPRFVDSQQGEKPYQVDTSARRDMLPSPATTNLR